MRSKVTKDGLFVPVKLLGSAKEVDIVNYGGRLIVTPLPRRDPIAGLGSDPIACGISDASENHDRYLYGVKH